MFALISLGSNSIQTDTLKKTLLIEKIGNIVTDVQMPILTN